MKIKTKTRWLAVILSVVMLLTTVMPAAQAVEDENSNETDEISPLVSALNITPIGSAAGWTNTDMTAIVRGERSEGASVLSVPAGVPVYIQRGGYVHYGDGYVTDFYSVWMGEGALEHEGDKNYATACFCACPSMAGLNTGHYSGSTVQKLTEGDVIGSTLNVFKATILTSPYGSIAKYHQNFWNVYAPDMTANDTTFAMVHAILGYLYDPGSAGTAYRWSDEMKSTILSPGGLLEQIITWANNNADALNEVNVYRLKGTDSGLQDLVWMNAAETYPVYVKKVSANPSVTDGNSQYSLGGAVYTVYRDAACKQEVGKLTTGENGVSDILYLTEGSYYAKESAAPKGYELNTEVLGPVTVNAANNPGVFNAEDTPVPQTGSGRLVKQSTSPADTDGNEYYTLANAEYTVYADEQLIQSVGVLTTDKSGTSNTLELDPGTYYVKETKAPAGYEEDETVHTMIVQSGETAVLKVQDVYVPAYVTLKKVSTDPEIADENDRYSLAGAEYGVYSDKSCTAKVGLLTTEADGGSNTLTLPAGTYYAKESKAPSGYRLNTEVYSVTVKPGETGTFEASDTPLMVTMEFLKVDLCGNAVSGAQLQLLDEAGTVVDEWISETEPHRVDRLIVGDTYKLHEVTPPECFFPAEDVVFTVEDSEEVKLVRMEDEQVPTLKTTATVSDGHIVQPVGTVELVDNVEYEGLVPGKEYTLNATLMDKSTGEPVQDAQGNPIATMRAFTPEEASGCVDVTFEITDASLLAGKVTVVFESLSKEGKELAIHAEIDDEDQSVYWPSISTTATINGEHEVPANGELALTDVVEYRGLEPNKEYVVKGTVMDKSTGEPFYDLTAETTFTPTESNGKTQVTFQIDTSKLTADTTLVVFETLYCSDTELAVHADLEDEGQTVTIHVPTMHTTATVNGKKTAMVTDKIALDDLVAFTNLVVGQEYTLKGTLMDKATGKAFLVNGKEVTSEVNFIPDQPNGEVKVTFLFDGSSITKETTLVVFESLYHDGTEVLVHADLDDADQTVTFDIPNTPQTGDALTLCWFYIGGGSLCAAALCGLIMVWRKKRNHEAK